MFRPNRRRAPFADYINWTDYRFDGPVHRPIVGRWPRRRQHPLVRILIVLAVVWVVTRLIRGRRHSGWL